MTSKMRLTKRAVNLASTLVTTSLVLLSTACAGAELETFTEPYHRVAVPAPEAGVLAEILVKEGDFVERKQLLAKLDDSVLEATMLVASAAKDSSGAVESAQADIEMRERTLKGYRDLNGGGNASQRELQRAENELTQAVARLLTVREEMEVRRLEFERVRTQLERRRIESPIDGIVVAIDREVGEYVSPSDPVVLHVVHLETLKAVFSVPCQAAASLRAGSTVPLSVGGKDTVNATIEFVSPLADPESNSVRVKLRLPNSELKLQGGVACRWNIDAQTTTPSSPPPPTKADKPGKFRTTNLGTDSNTVR